MPSTTTNEVKFRCAKCTREYRWKPELAGKQAKCKCGGVISVPRTPPPPPPPKAEDDGGMDDLYALAAEEKKTARAAASAPVEEVAQGYRCPSCGSQMPVGSMVCAACTLDLRTGARSGGGAVAGGNRNVASAAFGYVSSPRSGVATAAATRAPRNAQDVLYEGGKAISLYLPLGLIILGILFYFGSVAFSKEKMSAAVMIAFVGISIIIDAALMLVAMLVAVRTMDMGFGAFGPAVLKIIAIAVGPGALGAMVEQMLPGSAGMIAGGVLTIVLYFTLIKVLFTLDLGETLVLVGIIYAVKRWLGTLLVLAIIGLIMAGASEEFADVAIAAAAGDASSIGENGPRRPSPEEVREELDEMAVLALNSVRGGVDTLPWLESGPTRMLAGMDNARSQALVKALTAAGAKSVMVVHIADIGPNGFGTAMVVELPDAKPGRKKILDMYAKHVKEFKIGEGGEEDEDEDEDEDDVSVAAESVPEDVGQKYLTWYFASPYKEDVEGDDEMTEDAAPAKAEPAAEAPGAATEAPAVEAPPADAPAADAPAADAPATDAPATEAPATEAPVEPAQPAPAAEGAEAAPF